MLRKGIFNQYRWLLARLQWMLDGCTVIALLLLSAWYWQVEVQDNHVFLGTITFLLVLLFFHSAKLYRPWRGRNFMGLVRQVCLAWLAIVCILTLLAYFTKTGINFSRRVILTWIFFTPFFLIILRLIVYQVLHWARARGRNSRTIVIAGAGELGQRLARNAITTRSLGLNLLGFFDDALVGQLISLKPGTHGFSVLGTLDEMIDFIQAHKVDMVYLALPMRAEDRLGEIIDKLQDTTASVYFAPDIFMFSLLNANLTDLRGIPLISLWETPFFGVYGWLKRVEDLILGCLILILVSPLLLIIALGVKLTSPGSVLFKQKRYGLDGKEIQVYKFRTMTVCEDGAVVTQACPNDQRVTPFGKFLRRTSLDELPQFFNVIKGNMSIVGPRPHAVAHNEYYRSRIPGYMLRHKIRPGITGLAQINGCRGQTEALEDMGKRIEYDLEYFKLWSVWVDLKIIFKTMFLIVTDNQAY